MRWIREVDYRLWSRALLQGGGCEGLGFGLVIGDSMPSVLNKKFRSWKYATKRKTLVTPMWKIETSNHKSHQHVVWTLIALLCSLHMPTSWGKEKMKIETVWKVQKKIHGNLWVHESRKQHWKMIIISLSDNLFHFI